MSRERGSILLESAAGLLAVLLLVFGVVQFSLLQTDRGSVTYAVQQTARWASVRGAASGAPVDAEAVRKYLCAQAPVLDPARLAVRTEWLPDNQPGSRVRVSAEYRAPVFLRAAGPSMALSSTAAAIISQ